MKKPTIELWSTSYMVQTVDTDVLVILIGQFFYLQQLYSVIDLWIVFGVGKDYCFYSINHFILNIGEKTSKALPMFYTFTGCNTTSSFFRKEKKSMAIMEELSSSNICIYGYKKQTISRDTNLIWGVQASRTFHNSDIWQK